VARAEDGFSAVVALALGLTRDALSSSRAGQAGGAGAPGVSGLSPLSVSGFESGSGVCVAQHHWQCVGNVLCGVDCHKVMLLTW